MTFVVAQRIPVILSQSGKQASVQKVKLWCLDELAQAVVGPRDKCPDQKQALNDGNVFLRGDARQAERRTETAVIGQLPGVLCQDLEQPN